MTVSKPARRALLLVLAILFAVATVLYSVIWMFARRPFGDIGFRYTYALAKGSLEVSSVEPGSAAEQAGLRAGDRIVSINGQLLDTAVPSYRAFDLGKVGDGLQLTVNRPGTAGPLTIHEVIQPLRFSGHGTLTASQLLAARVLNLYPLLFLVVGLPVLFLRLEDRNAWLLAFLFGGFIAGAPLDEAVVPAFLRGFAISYRLILGVFEPVVFYFFFATFPASSVIDRRVPWLKWALLGMATVTAIPLGVWCLLAGGSLPFHLLGSHIDSRPVNWLATGYFLGSYILGLVSLVWNSIRPASHRSAAQDPGDRLGNGGRVCPDAGFWHCRELRPLGDHRCVFLGLGFCRGVPLSHPAVIRVRCPQAPGARDTRALKEERALSACATRICDAYSPRHEHRDPSFHHPFHQVLPSQPTLLCLQAWVWESRSAQFPPWPL